MLCPMETQFSATKNSKNCNRNIWKGWNEIIEGYGTCLEKILSALKLASKIVTGNCESNTISRMSIYA